jgi:hypothetical protein
MRLCAALTLGLILTATLPSPAQAAVVKEVPNPSCSVHTAPQELSEGEFWYSPDKQVELSLDAVDNMLVLKGPGGRQVWNSPKYLGGHQARTYAQLTENGELSVYYAFSGSEPTRVWQSLSGHDVYTKAALEICDDATMRIVSGPNLLWQAP